MSYARNISNEVNLENKTEVQIDVYRLTQATELTPTLQGQLGLLVEEAGDADNSGSLSRAEFEAGIKSERVDHFFNENPDIPPYG